MSYQEASPINNVKSIMILLEIKIYVGGKIR
jgi:hypothetical protein